MPVDDALMIELEALAKAEGKDSFHVWVGSDNYEMRVDSGARPAWIDRRILAIIRGSTSGRHERAERANPQACARCLMRERSARGRA